MKLFQVFTFVFLFPHFRQVKIKRHKGTYAKTRIDCYRLPVIMLKNQIKKKWLQYIIFYKLLCCKDVFLIHYHIWVFCSHNHIMDELTPWGCMVGSIFMWYTLAVTCAMSTPLPFKYRSVYNSQISTTLKLE